MIGVAVPQTIRGSAMNAAEMQALLDVVDRNEAVHSVWVADMPLAPVTEALITIGYAAGVTKRVRIGLAALLTPLYAPFDVARRLATLDQLSQGRLIVGVALGSNTAIYPIFGRDRSTRVEDYESGIHTMKELWKGMAVRVEQVGEGTEDFVLKVKPRQQPHPPIWMGGRHPRALARAVALGDGWIGAGAAPTAEFQDQARFVRQRLRAQGRPDFVVSKRVYVAVGASQRKLDDAVSEWFAEHYGLPGLGQDVAVVGDTATIIAGLQEVIDAGADLLILNPVLDEIAQTERLISDVVPHLTA